MPIRSDPSDNGGLFIGRRPGTAPVNYSSPPPPASEARRLVDEVIAALLLALMVVVNLCFWGPIPAAWLWMGARVNWWTDNLEAGLGVAFAGMLATLMGGLVAMRWLDSLWILARRASGHDQREGIVGRVFGICAIVGALIFSFWFFIIAGPGPMLAPTQ
jgi:hypothetical protein